MKRKSTCLAGFSRYFIFVFGWAFIFASSLSAQSVSTGPADAVISTEDLFDKSTVWKPFPDYNAVIAAEREIAAQSLAEPNHTDAFVALYTGYDKMLAYMQADMAVKAPIEGVAVLNFKKVSAEASSDPSLANLPVAEFAMLYAGLLTKLVNN